MFTPVALPPGCARLATSPTLTGSLPTLNTIGIVVVAALAASEGLSPPEVTITATWRLNEVRGELRQPIVAALCPAILDRDVATLDEARVLQATAKAGDEVCEGSGRGDAEEAHHRHRRLLRACRERPTCRAAEQRDELAPFHPIELHPRPLAAEAA
jgi:hypothetical protein